MALTELEAARLFWFEDPLDPCFAAEDRRAIRTHAHARGVSDLNAFARRNPAIFLGASVALGFALARVGKTAIERATEDNSTDVQREFERSFEAGR